MEKLKLIGVLELRFFLKGNLVETKKEKNLIVDSGYNALFSAMAGVTGKNITKVQCGSNGIAPTSGDTEITDAVDLTIVNIIASLSSLVITFQLGSGDANGLTISEFGTICADGTLFSRKSWTPFLKISDLSVEGTWTISRV